MRISTRMFQESAIRSVRSNLETLAQLQKQMATGLKVNTLSDDPQAAAKIMRLNSQLADLDQYQTNGTYATTRLNTEDVVLTSARDLIEQARTLALGVSGMAADDPQRQAALTAIEELRQQIVSYGNTKVGGEYIFGGGLTATPPFQADGTYVGDATVRRVRLDTEVVVPTNHTGDQVFSGVLAAFDHLEDELASGDQASINAAVTSLESVTDDVIRAQSEGGSRLQQIQTTSDALATRIASLLDQRDALRAADPTETSVKLIAVQGALEQAYAAIGKVLSTNLVDFLR